MRIACTSCATDLIQATIPRTSREELPFFCWHAHVYTYNRRKILVLINDLTGFPVIFYRPRVNQLKNFNVVVDTAIREAFLTYGIKPEHIDSYFNAAGPIVLDRKTSRRVLGHLTQWKYELIARLDSYAVGPFIDKQLTQPIFACDVIPFCWTNYQHCKDLMIQGFRDILSVNENELFAIESYELKLELKLNHHKVVRKILLPASTTLNRLHNLIQLVFGWRDSHLHQFLLLPQGAPSIDSKAKVYIVNAAKPLEETLKGINSPYMVDVSTTIKEAFSQQCDLWYEYDSGDGWQHKITLEKISILPSSQYRLLDSIGVCPPDDVGGEIGYEEFTQIMTDENHPCHADAKNWLMEQTKHRKSVDEINASLSSMI